MTQDELVTPREFAKRQGFKPNYGNELAKTGRLVMADDGKHCLYHASLERLQATRDPSKAGVAARHAAAREVAPPQDAAAPQAAATTRSAETGGERIGSSYQAAKAVRERYLALDAKRAYEVAIGQLRDAREVEQLAASVGVDLRQRLETLASALAPMLLGQTDEASVRALLQGQFHDALESAASHFRRLAQAATDNP